EVLASGNFDLLNIAHVRRLEEAARSGDVLVVAVGKGPSRAADRTAMIAALGCVHYVAAFNDPAPLSIVGKLRPDVVVNGCDESPSSVEVDNLVRSYGGQIRPAPSITRSAA
ncbi:MAG TPA: bifunctional heptose 7-phosphate kinase/heptose 1-phosphate adenyltransferase, partial [Pirellulales bacterium]|nr:bifunctional heptose 7-phosphate kinase/heptose 1-phosphate adenyltransferase [Pirellulales bacterium]